MTAPARKARPVAAGLAVVFLVACAACVSGPPILSPPPADVATLDGFGSLSLRGAGGSLRGRFSFLLSPPDMGRVEVLDPFGRTRAVLIFREGTAAMILPSRRAYWSGPEEELMANFIGAGLSARDLAGLIGGRWTEAGESGPAGWTLERDGEGRVRSGAKDGFRFEVEEFFAKTSVPRSVGISRAGDPGRLRVLQIRFNRPPRGDAFGLSELARPGAEDVGGDGGAPRR